MTETKLVFPRIICMEYRGVEFMVVQAIERGKWRWSVSVPDIGNRSGLAATKEIAAAHARDAISWLLAAKKRSTELASTA